MHIVTIDEMRELEAAWQEFRESLQIKPPEQLSILDRAEL